MKKFLLLAGLVVAALIAAITVAGPEAKPRPLDVKPPPLVSDRSVRYDYDIVYVRAPRHGDNKQIAWTEVFSPTRGEPGSDLMLLHPDGREEVLVAAGDDAITDPFVSFDGAWVYFARFHNVKRPGTTRLSQSSDLFKIHVKSRKIVRLTRQVFTPNTGVVASGLRPPGVYNLAPCPLPGGRIMFTSNRNGFDPTKGYTPTTLQLFVMDDPSDGRPDEAAEKNLDQVGYLNINSALHPTILADGRVLFTSYESQGLRDLRLWALWTIRPDGTHWEPLVSNFANGASAFHFQTQLSDGNIVFEEYYNLNNLGFGTYYRVAPTAPEGEPFFGPAALKDRRNLPYNGMSYSRIPFTPRNLEWLTPFVTAFDSPAPLSDRSDPQSPRAGKVTHPSGAPDNHLLTTWSPGPVNSNNGLRKPAIDAGIYLIKDGKPIREPGQMRLIRNDPRYNEQWPRALVPYRRIYGIDEPRRLTPLANDGKLSKHLPAGTPFGLVGTSSLYKREAYPNGTLAPGKVAAGYAGGNDPFEGLGTLAYTGTSGNWFVQGAETCRYDNGEIHAIRILVTEPTTSPHYTGKSRRLWWNAANERLRILGEIPVRKFNGDPKGSTQPLDPDGNPDTSFLAKIPADVAWTFQTLDRDGMVLNMAQTWHQVRPGEIRNDCGGCHAHSQKPTPFEKTAAAGADYIPFDLTRSTPLLTSRARDKSGKRWDADGATGLRYVKGVLNVEYYRDVKPIFERSCVACHTERGGRKAAGNLVLDDDQLMQGPGSLGGLVSGPPGKVPGTFFRLVLDHQGRFGHPSPVGNWAHPQASRYVRLFQARRSLLAWKIFGKRLDGWKNEDFAHEVTPGDPKTLVYRGKPFASKPDGRRLVNLAYTGSIMPPPAAVAGTWTGHDGEKIKVAPLTDEDRRTLVRWIDLGCPIDLAYDLAHPEARGSGWLQDDNRPTLTLSVPHAGHNAKLTHLRVGMYDYDSGLDRDSLRIEADFPVDGIAAGRNLADQFKEVAPGVWERKLAKPITRLAKGVVRVSVKDRQGNVTCLERTFSVDAKP
jgi:Hydrazine synthase alpha subunit middle domain